MLSGCCSLNICVHSPNPDVGTSCPYDRLGWKGTAQKGVGETRVVPFWHTKTQWEESPSNPRISAPVSSAPKNCDK